MVHGEVGDLGHLEEVIVRGQEPEAVTIRFQQMEEATALVLFKKLLHVLEVSVRETAIGDCGPLGHLVVVTARNQDPEVVTILLQQMVEKLVLVLVKKVHHVCVHQ